MGSDNSDKDHLYERVTSKEDHEQNQDDMLRQQVLKKRMTKRGPSSFNTGGGAFIILKWMCFVLTIFVVTTAGVIYFSDMEEAIQLRGSIKNVLHIGDNNNDKGRPEIQHGNSIHHNHTSETKKEGNNKESYFDRLTATPDTTPEPTFIPTAASDEIVTERPTPEPTPVPTKNPTPEPTPMPTTASDEKKEEESNNNNDKEDVPVYEVTNPEEVTSNTAAEVTAPPVTIPPFTLDETAILNENEDDDAPKTEDDDEGSDNTPLEAGDPAKKDPELKPGGPSIPQDDDNV